MSDALQNSKLAWFSYILEDSTLVPTVLSLFFPVKIDHSLLGTEFENVSRA